MELQITRFFNDAAPMDYSASVAEIGRDAGPSTWQAAMDDADEWNLLDNDEKREAFRDHIRGFGAWDANEIAAMTNQALNALCVQCIAGDIRECGIDTSAPDWQAYETGCESGRYSSRMFHGTDGEIYYYLGD